jgi:glycosyltransferase involved in cell wall biosynthesis
MKIAQVVCAFPPYAGGIGNSAFEIGKILATRHQVVNFTPHNLKPWFKYGHGAFLPQLLGKLRNFDYIYLHYPFFGTAEIVWLLKLFCRRPKLIIHYHMDVKNSDWLAKLLSLPDRLIRRSLFRQADAIVGASLDYIAQSKIKKYYRRHPEKFREIPFGVDLKKFRPKLINRPTDGSIVARAQEIVHYINDKFIKKDRLDLLFVGGLDAAHYFKGLDILLKALAEMTTRPWRLTVIGSGDRQKNYESLARRLSLNKRIDFRGKLAETDLIRAYQNADLLILPSINSNEAFGLVLIEALACGVPVIASDLPGVRRVFDSHKQGLLIAPGNAADLKKKLEFIFNNEEMRRVMSLAARRLAEEKYDLKMMEEKLMALYENRSHT